MPWADTNCEYRDWDMPLCPTAVGHQGNDIRGPTCDDNKWDVIAVESGIITQISKYPVIYLKGDSGTRYRYMHVHPDSIQVKENQRVSAGMVLAKISDYMDGQAHGTSIHLHFDAMQNIKINGKPTAAYVPIYTSLIVAYRKLN
jgi:murein DD-endopeptidase MepM/ murein hydrolase activator NlpD